ncbi:hypothetical protein GCM10011397_12870 [Wenyingzhuangia marina]|nr:hypothetical protein GCM10011397_12870 [Wenyingzhuangia marina]
MAGLHAFFHSDEDNGHINHCKVCEHVVLDNLTPSLASYTGDFEFDLLKKEITQEVKTDYNFVVISARDTSQLFSRPPPAKK